ncbi:2-dehydropantoate 2-reductase [Sporormia fimetaria CBS 119925]|uniref:2-dehydropantoate 2-reductase n=1 Tax=Sporormia fimetaria CBS 119925 TaxID=1340428 RepID=A0A6A6VAG2_9PLEO|nr:2-dehydropantoate 2-reductase [Sporormia fimetaria CBS 119925]
MTATEKPNILLFGAGSVGAVYCYLLSKVGTVTAVCRSNYDTVKTNGFIINSDIFGKNIQFRPNIVRSCSEAAANNIPLDYLVVCSKSTPGIPEAIRPAVTPNHTSIVLIQNGVGIEDEYVQAFETNPIVSCVLYMPATQRPAGVISHREIELLEVGNYPANSKSQSAANFVDLLTSAGATAKLYDDIQLKRWYKLLLNASWNPVCALTLCTDVDFMTSSEEATHFIYDIMMEVAAIARAYGHDISDDLVEYQLGRAKARISTGGGIEPSMMQDIKHGRRMEVDAIIGNAVRMAKEKNVPCEKLRTVYILVKALDSLTERRRNV